METIKHQIIRQKLTLIKQIVTEDKDGINSFLPIGRKIENLCWNMVY